MCTASAKALALVGSFLLLFGNTLYAQQEKNQEHTKQGSIYFSWGYNAEWYTRSTVHVKQGTDGNDYDLIHVKAHDHKGWDDGILNKDLTIPQYNYRLGYYFNEKQDLAIELNFDHTKFIIANGQSVRLKGSQSHAAADTSIVFSEANGFYYYLNNGANFFLINIVKRIGLYHTPDNKFRIDATGKAGIGPVIPHVENSFFGHRNDPGFQFGGWNTGLETAVRFTLMRYAYLEFSQKVDYARYSNLKIYNGTARQNFGTYELILSLGFTLPTTKGNPLFVSGGRREDKSQ
jgi:hypothetical protein